MGERVGRDISKVGPEPELPRAAACYCMGAFVQSATAQLMLGYHQCQDVLTQTMHYIVKCYSGT